MSPSRHYDTVAFDVKERASMLFFARTSQTGDIEDYLLLMRTIDEDFSDLIILEINEEQFPGTEMIRDVEMSENMLTLNFVAPVRVLDGASQLVLTFDNSADNRTAVEEGAFIVLGEKISGGHA
jgi:hypothetical protein